MERLVEPPPSSSVVACGQPLRLLTHVEYIRELQPQHSKRAKDVALTPTFAH